MDPDLEAFIKSEGLSLGPIQAPGAGQTGGGPAQQGSGLRVYTGSKYGSKESTVVRGGRQGDALVPGARRSVQGFTEEDDALENVQAQWFEVAGDDEKMGKWARLLYENGHIDEEDMADYYTLQKMWFSMAEESANLWTTGKKAVGIWDAPRFLSGAAWLGDSENQRLRGAAGATTGFVGSRTSVSKSVDLTDPLSAKALVNYTLSKALGREANAEELAAFTGALNSYESANPSISTTTATYSGEEGDSPDTSTVTTGGVTQDAAQQLLSDKARENPEYGAYQAATTYANALFASLSSPV